MKLLTIDLELNKNNIGTTKIIQIGYVITDTITGKVMHKQSLLVDPGEPIDSFITELTGITNEQIAASGRPLKDQYDVMVADCKRLNVASLPAQWGIGDVYALKEELGLTWDECIFKRRAIDVKAVYQAYAAFTGNTTKTGLASAMRQLGLTFEGLEHDALNDAYNTYLVLKHLVDKMKLSDKILKAVAGK